jgi:uncharacterized protein
VRVVGRVAELVRYPVKSMQGEALDRVGISASGLDGDRGWAVRDLATGRIASAKQPRPWRALLDCRARLEDEEVVVALPDGEELLAGDPGLAAALSGLVDRSVGLEPATASNLDGYDSSWPDVDGLVLTGEHELPMALATEAVRFVDVAALHLVTTATLGRLRELAPHSTMDRRRFRPNIVIDTGAAPADFVEDAWSGGTLRIGSTLELTGLQATPRCVMTTVEQPGLDHDPQVLATTARHNRQPFAGLGPFACAGIYAEVATPGLVAAGDEVLVG